MTGPNVIVSAPVTSSGDDGPSLLLRLIEQASFQGVTGAVVLFLVTRLIAISDRSGSTALGVINATGVPAILVGATVQILPLLFLFAATAAAADALRRWSTDPEAKLPSDNRIWTNAQRERVRAFVQKRRVSTAVALVLWAFVMTTVPSPVAPALLVSYVAYAVVALALFPVILNVILSLRERQKQTVPEESQAPANRLSRFRALRAAPILLLGLAILALVQVVFDRSLWLPPERVTVQANLDQGLVAPSDKIVGGTQPRATYVGYVLAEDDSWTSLLLENPRVVVRLHTPNITTRDVCSLARERPARPLVDKILGRDGESERAVGFVPLC